MADEARFDDLPVLVSKILGARGIVGTGSHKYHTVPRIEAPRWAGELFLGARFCPTRRWDWPVSLRQTCQAPGLFEADLAPYVAIFTRIYGFLG